LEKYIIGMTGKAGSGKNTVADILEEKYSYYQMSFAYRLKQGIKNIFNLTDNQMNDREEREKPLKLFPNYSVRKLYQYVGTELFRNNFDIDIWSKLLVEDILKTDIKKVVVTDLRFPNEKECLKNLEKYGCKVFIISVERDGFDGNIGILNHESESYNIDFDYKINNDGKIKDLYEKVEIAINYLEGK
jgi:dephospho-CoA kinase